MQGLELYSVLIPCEVLVVLLVLVEGYQEQWMNVPLEGVFPLHVLYQVWTHRGRYSGRGYVECWFYVFAELMLARLIVGAELPSSWLWLQALYVALAVMPLDKAVEREEVRGLVFLGEGLYKSSLLVDCLKTVVLAAKGFTQSAVLLATLAGLVVLLTAPVFDVLEQTWKQTKVDRERLDRYLRVAPVLVGALIGMLYWDWHRGLEEEQERKFTWAHFVGSVGFVAWYGHHALDYVSWEAEQQHKRR